MSQHQLDEERIFHLARKQPDDDARNEYLNQICAGDQALRARVEALLAAHEQEQSFLNPSPNEPAPTADHTPPTETSGQSIGRYKLLQEIGEGGMGTVFMAEQTQPVSRRVALKIIKPGMDSKAVIARFEAERQALAMMDHPNIAKVLDAGTTDSGRPYFVMELVKGVPITEYCDDQKLPIRDRLELFIQVCQAVQHAHQKGIIHRDIKPSNVLVAQYDSQPVPKIIDFGVAKAISQRLTEKTMFTQYGQIVGTLEYMSPEQAQFNQLDVDTRSDIYSLGVLLYELLTGETPFDGKRLRSSAFEEVLRILREEEPPKPSGRISTMGEKAVRASASRASEPTKLGACLRGDLDWIVMTALDKDRTRRYQTADGFGKDIFRFLSKDPVQARPPSTLYRLRKFAGKHKAPLSVATAIVLLLVAGTIITASQARNLKTKIQQLEDKDKQLTELDGQLRGAFRNQALQLALSGRFDNLEMLLQDAETANVPVSYCEMLRGLGQLHRSNFSEAIKHLRRAKEGGGRAAHALLADAYLWQGYVTKYWALLEDVRTMKSVTLEDKLFSRDESSPRVRVKQLTDVFDEHPLPVVRLYLGLARSQLALELGDVDMGREALDELRSAVSYLNNGPVPLAYEAWGHYVCLMLHGANNIQGSTREWHLAEGRRLANELSSFGAVSGPLVIAAHLLAYMEDPRAEQLWRKAMRNSGPDWRTQLAYFLLGRDDLSGALKLFDRENLALEDKVTYSMILLAHDDTLATKQKARSLLVDALQGEPPLELRLEAIGILTALGFTKEARGYADAVPAGADDFSVAILKLFKGDGGESDLLLSAGNSRTKQTTAYYFLGMKHLQTSREKARSYFGKSERLYVASGHFRRSRELREWLDRILNMPK